MKILHTSDWHLGQSFFTKSRKDEHQAFIAWLLNLIVQEHIDAVIIAGDIFDTGTPPSYARALYYDFVAAITKTQCSLIILGGNHDSVSMLNESKTILASLNTYVIPNTSENIAEQIIELKNPQGDISAIVCAIPFIRPRDVITSNSGDSGQDKRQALAEAIKDHYHSVFNAALERKKINNLNIPIIATGHLTALGVSQSESVRDIYIGTLDGFAADGFPPADYIALGHIHRPQIVAKAEHIRYSGSPIPLSFDELKSKKQVVMVTFENSSEGQLKRTITPIEVPLFQPMSVITGNLNTIEAKLKTLDTQQEKPVWLLLEVEQQDQYSDLQQRIQTLTQDLNVEVLRIKRVRSAAQQALSQQASETLAELSPTDVFLQRLALETIDDDSTKALAERAKVLFTQVLVDVSKEAPTE
jgi:exonuclease SbcD